MRWNSRAREQRFPSRARSTLAAMPHVTPLSSFGWRSPAGICQAMWMTASCEMRMPRRSRAGAPHATAFGGTARAIREQRRCSGICSRCERGRSRAARARRCVAVRLACRRASMRRTDGDLSAQRRNRTPTPTMMTLLFTLLASRSALMTLVRPRVYRTIGTINRR